MSRFRIVVAGCGSMANEWIRYAASRADAEVVALVDINLDSAKAMAENHSLAVPTFVDLKQSIGETRANLVFDITTPEAHRDIVTTAMTLGCDVFGEKPMAASLADAKAMVDTSNTTGKTYAVMQNRRYLKLVRSFRDIVGTIGQLGSIHADFFLGPHFGGFRDAMDSPLILDMAIHTFDQARFIGGADPVSVYCHEFNPPGSWYQGDASAICIFEMSDKTVFCYRGSWCAEGFPTSWEASWRVTGSKGTAIWDGHSLPQSAVVVPSADQGFTNNHQTREGTFDWAGQEGHFGCLDEMFNALLEGRKAETDCADNIKSMAMVFGAIASAREQRKIPLAL